MNKQVDTNMFKEPQLVEGVQDTYSRKVFVVSPKDCLVEHLIACDPRLERFKEALRRPTVFFTPEVPFEAALEGYSPGLKRIIRREFLQRYRTNDFEELPSVPIPDETFMSDEDVIKQFDVWWTIHEADDYFEFEKRAWISK